MCLSGPVVEESSETREQVTLTTTATRTASLSTHNHCMHGYTHDEFSARLTHYHTKISEQEGILFCEI